MIIQTDRLLEHPEVVRRRHWLESQLDAGNLISYSNLRWHIAHGVCFLFVPKQPLQFIHSSYQCDLPNDT